MEDLNLQLFYQKKIIAANAEIAKQQQLNEIRDVYAQRREVRHEFQRESRRAQYNKITIKEEGKIIMETRNSWINIPEREVANFKFLGLFPLMSSDGDEGISALLLEVAGEEKYIYLEDCKVGKEDYLLKKIIAVGGDILTKSKKDRQSFLLKFWTAIYPLRTEVVVIPTHVGWIAEEKNQFKFVEKGTKIWDEFVKKAK